MRPWRSAKLRRPLAAETTLRRLSCVAATEKGERLKLWRFAMPGELPCTRQRPCSTDHSFQLRCNFCLQMSFADSTKRRTTTRRAFAIRCLSRAGRNNFLNENRETSTHKEFSARSTRRREVSSNPSRRCALCCARGARLPRSRQARPLTKCRRPGMAH